MSSKEIIFGGGGKALKLEEKYLALVDSLVNFYRIFKEAILIIFLILLENRGRGNTYQPVS